jgi:uncharacterized protein YndB with AHSA1/START domain
MSDQPKARGKTLVLEMELPASPEEVWRMLTEPEELAQWFAPFVEGSSKPGETLLLGWGPEMRWRTVVESAEPGLSVRWRDELDAYKELGPGSAPMVVEWLLTSARGGTRLRLVHSGFGDGQGWDDMYDATQTGWRFYLWHLRETLRRHPGGRRTVLFVRRPSSESREALSGKLFGSGGFDVQPAPAPGRETTLALGGKRERFSVEFHQAPGHLWGRLPDLGEALLMVEMEPGQGTFHTGVWLSTWGLGAEREHTVQRALNALADRVFPAAPDS